MAKPVMVQIAQSQSAFTLETYQGVVTRTYPDPSTGNILKCDVRLVGTNAEVLKRVPNNTTSRFFVGAPVTVNFVKGQKADPQINGGGGAGAMASIAAATTASLNGLNAGLDDIGEAQPTIPSPVWTTAYDVSTPNCFIVSPGANVVITEVPGYQYGDDIIANSVEIAVQIPLYTTLPNPAMTTLPDGSLARTHNTDLQNDLWLLDRTHSHWVSLGSVGSSSSSSGVNILGSLPLPQSYMQGELFLVSNFGSDDLFYICRELSDSTFEMAQVVTANITSPTVGQTLLFDANGRLYNASPSGGVSWPYTRPLMADFTVANTPTGCTHVDGLTGIAMYSANNGLTVHALLDNNAPGATFDIRCAFKSMCLFNNSAIGLYVVDGSGKLATWGPDPQAMLGTLDHWNSYTSFNGNPFNYSGAYTMSLPECVGITYDGTNFRYYVGPDPSAMVLAYTQLATTFLGTPVGVGIFQFGYNQDITASFYHYTHTA